MDSSTTVSGFYGTVVRTADLIAAGRAFTALEPALRVLDLISIRRRKGTLVYGMLRGQGMMALGRVPEEVWLMVKELLVEWAVLEARVGLQDELHCEWCLDGARDRFLGGMGMLKWELWDPVEADLRRRMVGYQRAQAGEPDWVDHCDHIKHVPKWCGGQKDLDKKWDSLVGEVQARPLTTLLARHRLYAPMTTYPSTPRSATATVLSIVEADDSLSVPSSPPPDAARRLARFLNTWHVAVLPPLPPPPPAQPRNASDDDEGSDDSDGFDDGWAHQEAYDAWQVNSYEERDGLEELLRRGPVGRLVGRTEVVEGRFLRLDELVKTKYA